jgi:beta-barrel assembly-enhancing protease
VLEWEGMMLSRVPDRLAQRLLGIPLLLLTTTLALGQTQITPPPNNYSPQQDVELGRKAAGEVEKQLPVLHDDAATSYVRDLGERLVQAIPPELRHSEFNYTFDVVNVSDINAFALPGGPMFVNRGMIEAAANEGEVAGVMAHELSHVILRHGTAQASKASKYAVGQAAGTVLGAILGGVWGNVISEGTQFGLGTAFMRFSRDFEKQADIEGSHIMAAAGYDPRDMASMFKTIEKKSGPGGPAWLSDHPNPGDRSSYITQEAERVRVTGPTHGNAEFERVTAHLRSLPPAPTSEQASKNSTGTQSGVERSSSPTVDPPSSRFRAYNEGDLFRVSVPSNWLELQGSNAVTFAPEGGYGRQDGQPVFTHGIEIGVSRNRTNDLAAATDDLIRSLASGNPDLRRARGPARSVLDSGVWLRTHLTNTTPDRRPEVIELYTTRMRDGRVLHALGVAPSDAFDDYDGLFQRIVASIQEY